MGTDRFVRWNERRPAPGEIRTLLEDYLGGAAEVTFETSCNRLFATFPQPSSSPLQRLYKSWCGREERWFEVYEHVDAIDVITREQDEFTSNIAIGFARLCARWYGVRCDWDGA